MLLEPDDVPENKSSWRYDRVNKIARAPQPNAKIDFVTDVLLCLPNFKEALLNGKMLSGEADDSSLDDRVRMVNLRLRIVMARVPNKGKGFNSAFRLYVGVCR